MSKQLSIDSIEIQLNPNRKIKRYKDSSFLSNEQSFDNPKRYKNPQVVDFQEYLHTEHYSPQHSETESFNYRKEQLRNQRQTQNRRKKKLIIQIAENYTFADQNSHRKRSNSPFKQPLQSKYASGNYHQQFSQREQKNKYSVQEKSIYQSFKNQNSSKSSKQISLSDNQQESGAIIYKQNQIQEQMFLKISEQTKQILNLQQKMYHFQDFCKRLLKSETEYLSQIQELNQQLKTYKNKIKQKNKIIKELEEKVQIRQKAFNDLKSFQKEQKNVSKASIDARDYSTLQKDTQIQNRILMESKNLNMQYSKKFQNQNKLLQQNYAILQQNYRTLMVNYSEVQCKVIQTQKQFTKNEQQNKILKLKNQKVQNMNKILQKQISQLNIKIFQLEKQIQKTTCKKYASNLTRIKNLSTQGNQYDMDWRINQTNKIVFENLSAKRNINF